jgi:hypothetical protein
MVSRSLYLGLVPSFNIERKVQAKWSKQTPASGGHEIKNQGDDV